MAGQDTIPATLPAQQARSVLPQPLVTPRTAFLRALAVPGWGHMSLESYTRGGFYVFAEAVSTWMVVRVRNRIGASRRVRDLRVRDIEYSLALAGETDPLVIQDAIDEDDRVRSAENAISARDQQFEDWLSFGLFMVLLSGADAYVSAHLADFPEPVGVRAVPLESGMEVGLSVPLRLGGGPKGLGR